MVHLEQTVHLSCTDATTVSKWSTIGCVQNEFFCLWYVLRKPCNYLALTLPLSLNGLKCDSTWQMSHRWSIRCVQNDFWPYVTFGANHASSCVKISTISEQTKMSIHLSLITEEYHRVCLKRFSSLWYVRRKPCTYLASRLALSPNRQKQVTTWASSPRSTIGCIPKWFLIYVWCKPCTYLALTLIVSPNGLKRDSIWPMSLRKSIGCVQNDFWAYGTFVANCSSILRQD
jgi:hypothetical protein